MMALLLYKLFGLRKTFLVAAAGLFAIDLGYFLLYHVALKRSGNFGFDENQVLCRGEKWNEAKGEKQKEDEGEAAPELH